MIKVIVIIVSTFAVLIGMVGVGFSKNIGFDGYDTLKFMTVSLVVGYGLGYELIYKEWKLKKTFIVTCLLPIALGAILYFIP
ncbi:hypothetical protein [Pseudoalteromonas luteoviolacea]|uniref:Uncharacterized protein n=1 Tax=Pseudoalteromonas luteoviolacea S4054 TaxID=1129367 RepID=A0A0F6AHL1_9GAMM|nr:hypothetical protein [Pseudoalteromonas luteoviolacea]AOT07723.1 hypothetical protein S4054249_07640 [Pseudoalteromonas luteoviolacea]AOT12639.1 hypothetical protein S40542_07640 [Pseudoalteromonas luteoviolacea]AOT17553.1 hypothetical protein S4054_07640 [Pseudoalteromonas luteoviolacea]KKE85286.1 hypothetical protein N479_26075 [Pseudoalteromonas luteoviolacea S4054]KZN77558.1 hypothetical protein N481_26295 [Pseudoalteromonas luteoviolacea S4047-1]